MSLYTVVIDNREYAVNITAGRCTVNGEPVNAQVVSLNGNGLQLVRRGGQSVEVFLSAHEDDVYQMTMSGGHRIVTRVTSQTRRRSQAGPDAGGGNVLVAPMHGLVVDVPVHEGDTVEQGQTLVVLESMKMQMQLRSPRAVKLSKVCVQAGGQVEKGALLVQFEEQSKSNGDGSHE
jgi:biotin carboxyl carrier protein